MKFTVSIIVLFLGVSFVLSTQAQQVLSNKSETAADIEKERTPQLENLYELVRTADRIVVRSDSEKSAKTLFDSSKPRDLVEFQRVLKLVVPDEWTLAVCADPYIILYRKDKEIVSIGNVLGSEVRTSVWSGNAQVADPEKWLEWFDSRGMPQVRRERDAAITAERKQQADEDKWYAAMPRGIKEPFEKQMSSFGLPSMNDTSGFGPILEKEYPEKNVRIIALLHWFGSGAGPWSGYPGYESIAEDILFTFTTKEILEALKVRKLSVTEVEGAANS